MKDKTLYEKRIDSLHGFRYLERDVKLAVEKLNGFDWFLIEDEEWEKTLERFEKFKDSIFGRVE